MKESLDRAFAGEAHAHRTTAAGRHFETVYSPVRGPDGDVAFVSIRVADVTARETALAELAALNATLEQRVAQRGRSCASSSRRHTTGSRFSSSAAGSSR